MSSLATEAPIADVRALPGIRYADTAHLTRLVAPPYDVIPDADIAGYLVRSPHNVIRLIRPGHDYDGAARTLDAWLQDGTLRADDPSMYVHEVDLGDGRTRRDLLAALRLEPYDRRVVLPHERTHRGPKEDRLALMRATRASLEPLWFVYDGAGGELKRLLDEAVERPPDVTFNDPDGLTQRLWIVPHGAWTGAVTAALAPLQLLIADGHHRYETALAYAEEAGGPPDAASRFTLALLTDIRDPGPEVLPPARARPDPIVGSPIEMPIYGYRCRTCGHEFEVLQKMSDTPLKTCPKCSGQLAKIVYPAGIVYKGSGYYSTDYKNGGKAASAASSNGAKSDSDSSSGADT